MLVVGGTAAMAEKHTTLSGRMRPAPGGVRMRHLPPSRGIGLFPGGGTAKGPRRQAR